MARPTTYNDAKASIICERLADGESLKKICASKGMPNKATVFRWLRINEEFRVAYAVARDAQADGFADEIVEIADTPIEGSKTKTDKDGNVLEVTTGDMIEHRRLQIEARKWVAAKLKPKKYGDKIEVEANIDLGLAARIQRAKERAKIHQEKKEAE